MLVIIGIFVYHLIHIGGETVCGRLKENYIFKAETDAFDCQIRLYPSAEMEGFIKVTKQYRWIHFFKNSSHRVILQKNVHDDYDMTKYTEEDYTLTVRQLISSDEGKYKVHCWSNDPNFPSGFLSSEVIIKIPEKDITLSSPRPEAGTQARLGNATIIVVSVCAVLVVFIISATVFLVRKKQIKRQEDARILMNHREETSVTVNRPRQNDNETVYNEIDIEVLLDYAQVEHTLFDYSQDTKLDHSPALPQRPGQASSKEDLNNVEDNQSEHRDVEYSIVDHTLSTGDHRPGHGESLVKLESTIPVYSQVMKRKTKQLQSLAQFNVAFPNIDCKTLTRTLGEHYRAPEVCITKNETPVYSNLVSKSIRRKSQKKRASRRDLQYAILDLASPGENDGVVNEKNIPCIYADIDFERKAFVAPKRKAPSSWYKRKNRNKDP